MMELDTDVDPGSQPHQHDEKAFSQPLLEEAKTLLTKARRSITDRDYNEVVRYNVFSVGKLPDKQFDTVEALRREVFEVIIQRLKLRGVASPMLQEKHLLWCLPSKLEYQDAWKLLLEDPLMVPTHMFDQLLSLSNLFYLRYFTIRAQDLRNVFHDLLDDGYDMNDRVFTWIERIELLSENTYVTLRYGGQSQNRPWDRHVSDIYSKSLRSFLGRFLKTLGKWCPEVLSDAVVQVVSRAITIVSLSAELLDLREQVLIALCGGGSLNAEAGGKDATLFTEEDHTFFLALNTNAVKSFQQLQPCSSVWSEKRHPKVRGGSAEIM